jgi:hypothetical protein
MKRACVALSCVFLLAWLVRPALAQTPAAGKLTVTVVDQSGGVIPNATVTVTGLQDATKTPVRPAVKTTDKGVATLEGLAPGRYAIQAEFPGFDPNVLKDVAVKAGDNKQVVILALKHLEDSIMVGRDKQAAASDRGVLFGSALTREQIDALSDDPAEMRRQLLQMAGQDAIIRVDSFEGQELPAKSMIKSIHITRDQFAAETHSAGGTFVDIITQPGIGALQKMVGGSFHNSAMETRNPLTPLKGPSQNYNWQAGLRGTLIKERSTFAVNVSQLNAYSTPNLYANTGTGTRAENLNLRTPTNRVGVSGLFDYAITKDQTIRLAFEGGRATNTNQGVGSFDLIERAFSSENKSFGLRITEAGPLGRRFFTNTRFSLGWSDSAAHSVVEAPTVFVLDSFRGGGAQQKGGTHSRNFILASDLDYVRGLHSWRTGIQIDGSHYRSDAVSNYLGTYTFESLAAYAAGQPRSFTRRVGDPNIAYWNVQVGVYLQDDIRLRKNLSLSPGVRFEAQTHLKDYNNIGPRFGMTWAPFKSGKTSLRGSWGIFYDWQSANTYQQTIQNDGFHLLDVNLVNPGYPDPGALGAAPPVNRYLFGDDLRMVRNMRVAFSINQTLSNRVNINATVSDVHGRGLLVGSNLNTPKNGVRPDAAFANIFETNSLGRSNTRSLSASFSLNLAPMSSASASPQAAAMEMMVRMGTQSPASAKRFEWRRGLNVFGGYRLSRSENDTDGPFAVPATGDLAAEWGPSSGDVRHNVQLVVTTGALRNLNASVQFFWSSAPPITIRTGLDNNGDLIFNDRPAGVGRNSERTVPQWSSSANVSYTFAFGQAKVAVPQGVVVMGGGGSMNAMAVGGQSASRYRLVLNVSIQNLTNHTAYSGFSGVMTSPFFLKPVSASGQRSINFSLGLTF